MTSHLIAACAGAALVSAVWCLVAMLRAGSPADLEEAFVVVAIAVVCGALFPVTGAVMLLWSVTRTGDVLAVLYCDCGQPLVEMTCPDCDHHEMAVPV